MNKKERKVKLSTREISKNIVRAAIQAIPRVGSSLAQLYFGFQDEIRFKRLENFYKIVSEELEGIKANIAGIEKHNKEEFFSIIEILNSKIEREHREEKIKCFKSYFKNTLIDPVCGNYDERRFFLDALDEISPIDCRILALLNKEGSQIQIQKIILEGTELYRIVGSVNKLKSYGFLWITQSSRFGGMEPTKIDYSIAEFVTITELGKCFCGFCLKD